MNRVLNPISLFLLSICCAHAQQKDASLLKSTINTVSSSSVKLSSVDYTVQQSIGQSGIIGTVSANNATVQQGFLNSTLFFNIDNSEREEFEERLEVVVSPNPFVEYIKIDFSRETKFPIHLRIFDTNGKGLIYQRHPPGQSITIPMNNIIIGTYILRIVTGSERFTEKLLKVRE